MHAAYTTDGRRQPAAIAAFPARYTHSPFETGHLGDIEALTNWLCVFVRDESSAAE